MHPKVSFPRNILNQFRNSKVKGNGKEKGQRAKNSISCLHHHLKGRIDYQVKDNFRIFRTNPESQIVPNVTSLIQESVGLALTIAILVDNPAISQTNVQIEAKPLDEARNQTFPEQLNL